jgi:hypothetical protein
MLGKSMLGKTNMMSDADDVDEVEPLRTGLSRKCSMRNLMKILRKRMMINCNPDEIMCGPALRQQIEDYHPDVQAQVRRAYLLKGPTQPIVKFPSKNMELGAINFLKIGIRSMIVDSSNLVL